MKDLFISIMKILENLYCAFRVNSEILDNPSKIGRVNSGISLLTPKFTLLTHIQLEQLSYPYELLQKKCWYFLKAYSILVQKLALKQFFIYGLRKYCNFLSFLKNPKGGPFYKKNFSRNFHLRFRSNFQCKILWL